jgi:PAS domain S-box-containing protein
MVPEHSHHQTQTNVDGYYRNLVETIDDLVWELDQDFVVTYVSPQVERLLGYEPGEVIARSWLELAHPKDAGWVRTTLSRHALKGTVFTGLESRMVAKSGREILVESNGRPFFSSDGKLGGFRGVARNIGQRRHQEEKLHFQELFDNVDEAVVIFDRKGRIVAANDSMLTKIGYRRRDLPQLMMQDFVDPSRIQELEQITEKIWQHKKNRFEIDIRTSKGSLRPSEISARVVSFQGQDCLLCMGRDISETRLIQDKLIRSERLAATGQLSASIAHEINSPLQGVAALLNVIRKAHPDDAELIQNIDLINDAFESIRDTVRHLLDLNRPGRELKQPVNLNRIIEDTLALVGGHLRKSNVQVRRDLCGDIPSIIVSPQQMGQVFLNLINNAVEAMTGLSTHDSGMKQQTFFGGEIFITTAVCEGHLLGNLHHIAPGIPDADLLYVLFPLYTLKRLWAWGWGSPSAMVSSRSTREPSVSITEPTAGPSSP